MLPFAAATSAKMLTESICTIFGRLFKLNDLSLAKIFLFTVYLYVGDIAGNRFFNKKDKIAGFANTFALFGYINNGNILENEITTRRLIHWGVKLNLFYLIRRDRKGIKGLFIFEKDESKIIKIN